MPPAIPLTVSVASAPADARIGADSHHDVGGVAGQVDDLVPRGAAHGRACDSSGEPVPRLDRLALCPLTSAQSKTTTREATPSATTSQPKPSPTKDVAQIHQANR